MTQQYPWADHLGISAEQIKEWEGQLRPGEPLLAWAIKNSKISESQLIAWSQNFYGLPLLKHSFFQKAPDISFWEKFKDSFIWTEHLVPLHEWDRTLFVGCLEPPRNLDLGIPVQFLLCRQQDLSFHWHQLQKNSKLNIPTETPEENFPWTPAADGSITNNAPEEQFRVQAIEQDQGTEQGQDVEPEQNEDKTIKVDINTLSGINVPTPPAQEATPAPEGLASMGSPKFDFDQLKENLSAAIENAEESQDSQEPEIIEMPDGFQANLDLSALDFSSIQAGPADTAEETEQPAKPVSQASPPKPPQSQQPNIFADDDILIVSSDEPASTVASTPTPAATTSPQPPQMPNFTDELPDGSEVEDNDYFFPESGTSISTELVKSTDELSDMIFDKLAPYFENQILFVNEGDGFIPLKWRGNWQPSDSAKEIPLVTNRPNVFHIVNKSKKPFHGPVAPNEINQSFFDAWNQSEYPVSMTAYPINDQSRILAILVGTHSKSSGDFSALRYLDVFTPPLVPMFQNLKALKAS